MYNVLICDDEVDIVSALKIYLTAPDINIFCAYTGKQAVEMVDAEDIHLVLLDIMMPQMDGISAAVKLRETSNVPIIFLSAKSEDSDKILGLNVGADDYITKPFNPVEVMARVRSHLRRYFTLGSAAQQPDSIRVGGLELADSEKKLMLDGEHIALTPTEYDILKLLMSNAGKVFSPNEIYERVWNDAPYASENTIAVHIRHIREKIEIDPSNPRYLKVVWGRGYKIERV
jgi:DNA-binding response OmpR family regulator